MEMNDAPVPAPPGPGDAAYPGRTAPGCATLTALDTAVAGCRACPRLVDWRERAARQAPPAHRAERYWARPVPGLGPPDASIALVGLAPSAHGGNRTGRMFTGDPSGDVLIRALYEVGLASGPTSRAADDGLRLLDTRITAPVHCAPPENAPTTAERDTCRPWLTAELGLLAPRLRVIVCLGGFGWRALLPVLRAAGRQVPRPQPVFGHGAHTLLAGGAGLPPLHLLGCYHPSRRNMATGTLTAPMLTDLLRRARELAADSG